MNAKTLLHTARQQMKPEEIGSHESDLYLKVTPISRKLIRQYDFHGQVEQFRSAIDHTLWYDIPFANSEWWEEKCKGVSKS